MLTRVLGHRTIVYVALGVLLGAGGSYALAAGGTKTIVACADRGTGVLHLRAHGRCRRGQTRLVWNQRGPQGVPGKTGPPGTPAVSIWGSQPNSGSAFVHGLTIQHASTGTYNVTITDPSCTSPPINAAWVSAVDGNPPGGFTAGAFPVAWVSQPLGHSFTVFTGVVVGGTFTPADRAFNVYDTC